MATILVVEDDKNSGYLIKRNLLQAGYEVILAENGEDALTCFNSSMIDLCILDIMLPKIDGLTLARSIKSNNAHVPFIFLSARAFAEDIIEGFKLGCDDYITKPFNLEELLLRINVVLKRKVVEEPQVTIDCPIAIGENYFNYKERTLKINGKSMTLSSKESSLLKVLLIHKNDVVSRSQILINVWGKDDYYTSKSLDVYLTKIRKLSKMMKGVELQNIHGYGYKLLVNGLPA